MIKNIKVFLKDGTQILDDFIDKADYVSYSEDKDKYILFYTVDCKDYRVEILKHNISAIMFEFINTIN